MTDTIHFPLLRPPVRSTTVIPRMPRVSRQGTLAGFDDPPIAASAEVEERAAAERTPEENASKECQPADETPNLAGKTVYVVDSHSLIYQVFHALPEMSGPSGQPVGAVQGFVRDLLDLIEVRKADYLICAFDERERTFRHEIYERYKAERDEMPADLQLQMPVIRRFVDALGILSLSIEGYEADDILATIARQVEAIGGHCLLVTNDKDCRQLITERVQLYNIRKNEVFDAVALMATWGIRPDQVVDFQAIQGDKTDGIPGVPGIGPKGAQELLTKYNTLDGVLAHIDEISGAKRKENLINGRGLALTSRELARLKTDMDIVIDWNAARVGHINSVAVADLCRECGFRQIARRIEALTMRLGVSPAAIVSQPKAAKVTEETEAEEATAEAAAAGMTTAASPEWKANYRTVATKEELADLVALLSRQKQISFDTETTSLHPRRAEIVGYSFAWAPGQAAYIPVRAPAGEPQLDSAVVLAALKPVLEDPRIQKVGQNLKYDMVVLRNAGIELAGVAFDTMVADYLLEPGERSHNMDDMARRYLGHQTITIDQLIGTGKNQKRMDEVSVPLIMKYAAEDADVPLRLKEALQPRLQAIGLISLLNDLEMPLIELLAEMEFNGIRVDVSRLRELSEQFNERIMRLEREIFAIAGQEFNIDSRIQLGQLLFEQLKLPVVKRTRTGPS